MPFLYFFSTFLFFHFLHPPVLSYLPRGPQDSIHTTLLFFLLHVYSSFITHHSPSFGAFSIVLMPLVPSRSFAGFMIPQGTIRRGSRCSTSKAFIRPVRLRKNLHVAMYSFVTKVCVFCVIMMLYIHSFGILYCTIYIQQGTHTNP